MPTNTVLLSLASCLIQYIYIDITSVPVMTNYGLHLQIERNWMHFFC
jgi:hypothetical protein